MKKVFLSYARDDDEPFVHQLVSDLIRSNTPVWWDRLSMDSRGQTFLQVIRDAISDECDRLVLVVGPAAVTSSYVEAEWRHALNQCKVVVPVVRRGDPGLVPADVKNAGYNLIPAELKNFHAPDFRDDGRYDAALAELQRVLERAAEREPAALHHVPAPARHWLMPAASLDPLREHLMASVLRPIAIGPTGQAAALAGMGGLGKSVMAASFARDCRVRRAFHDGVVWLSFGRGDQALVEQARRLGVALEAPALAALPDESALDSRLASALRDRVCLLVLDDVWRVDQVAPFARAVASTRVGLLLTTRDSQVARAFDAAEHRLDLLDRAQARALLARAAGLDAASLPEAADAIVDECAGLPLALALMGRMLEARPADRWRDALARLRSADLERLRVDFPDYRAYPNLMAVIEASISSLEAEDATGYLDLAILDDEQRVPGAMLEHLWRHEGFDAADARERIDRLVDRSLLHADQDGWLRLHDIQLDYVHRRCPDPVAVRSRLLDSYRADCEGDWTRLTGDGFIRENLVRLLLGARRQGEVHGLLWSPTPERPAWIASRVERAEVQALRDDLRIAMDAVLKRPALHLRYSLALSSLGSTGTGMPPALWKAAVRDGLLDAGAALDLASAMPQPDAAALLRKCDVLMSLGEAAADLRLGAGRAAVEAARQAFASHQVGPEWIAAALANIAVRADAATLGDVGEAARVLGQAPLRDAAMGAVAVRFAMLGDGPRAVESAAEVRFGDGPAYVVRDMARLGSADLWSSVLAAYEALPRSAQSIAVAEVVAAAVRRGSSEDAWRLLEPLGNDELVRGLDAMASALNAEQAAQALARLKGRSASPTDLIRAKARLIARLAPADREEPIGDLWRDGWQGGSRRAADLLEHLPAAMWPAAAITSGSLAYLVSDDAPLREAAARGLAERADTQVLLSWIDSAVRDEPSRASDFIRGAARVATLEQLDALAMRTGNIGDARLRESADAAVFARYAALGRGAHAWRGAMGLSDPYAREQAVASIVPHLRGSDIAPALTALGRINDRPERQAFGIALACAFDRGSFAAGPLRSAMSTGALRDAHWRAHLVRRLLRGESACDLLAGLRAALRDNAALAGALVEFDAVQGSNDDGAMAEAMLAVPDVSTLARLLPIIAPRLPRLRAPGWEPLRQRLTPGAEGLFDQLWRGGNDRGLTDVATLLAWCRGVEAVASRMVERDAAESVFDRELAVRLGCLPFEPEPAQRIEALSRMVVASADPYVPLIRSGNLKRVPAGLLPAFETLLQRCNVENIQTEASHLAVAAIHAGRVEFGMRMVERLHDRPDAAHEILLARLDVALDAQVALAAADTAMRIRNAVNAPDLRGDAISRLVARALRLDPADAAKVLARVLSSMAPMPRPAWFLDAAALAPLLAVVMPDGSDTQVLKDVESATRWWP